MPAFTSEYVCIKVAHLTLTSINLYMRILNTYANNTRSNSPNQTAKQQHRQASARSATSVHILSATTFHHKHHQQRHCQFFFDMYACMLVYRGKKNSDFSRNNNNNNNNNVNSNANANASLSLQCFLQRIHEFANNTTNYGAMCKNIYTLRTSKNKNKVVRRAAVAMAVEFECCLIIIIRLPIKAAVS